MAALPQVDTSIERYAIYITLFAMTRAMIFKEQSKGIRQLATSFVGIGTQPGIKQDTAEPIQHLQE